MAKQPMLLRARAVLRMSGNELARALGASRRTGQRWNSGQATVYPHQWKKLATLLVDKDRETAAACAELGRTTLEAMGLAPAPVAASAPFAPALEDIVDSVVCVAAEVANVAPASMRSALLAAFTRARKIGLSVEAAEKALLAKVPREEAQIPRERSAK
jgi:hypothetical protein